MQIPFIDLKKQYLAIKKDLQDPINRTLDSGLFIKGPDLECFENDFAKFNETKFSIGVGSGTDALHLCLMSLNIGKGDEVLLPVNTFVATAYSILYVGAKPIFIDVDPKTYNIDVSKAEGKITRKTKAIIPVHLYGQPANMDGLSKLAKKYKIFIVEDACQAHGATYKGKFVGSFGTVAAFSFYPSKNLGAYGDGGAITTNSAKLVNSIKSLREYGSTSKYSFNKIGINSRLDSLQAVILQTKLKHLKEWNRAKLKLASYYNLRFKEIPEIITPITDKYSTPVYHLYVIRTPKRDALLKHLKSRGVETGIHYPIPLHLQKSLQFLGYKKGDFPVAEHLSNEILSLPMFPELTSDQQDYIVSCIKEFFK